MKTIKHIAAIALLLASAGASAAQVDYKFDSLSRVDTGPNSGTSPSRVVLTVTGVLQNATTPTTVAFDVSVGSDYAAYANRCIPLLLTMMEKPGRYWFNLSIDTAPLSPPSQVLSCGLEVKS